MVTLCVVSFAQINKNPSAVFIFCVWQLLAACSAGVGPSLNQHWVNLFFWDILAASLLTFLYSIGLSSWRIEAVYIFIIISVHHCEAHIMLCMVPNHTQALFNQSTLY